MNISKENIYGKCDLKCQYNFTYEASPNLVATNQGIDILLKPEEEIVAPVYFNQLPYRVAKILIYAPSLHNFNEKKTDAELVIVHMPENGGTLLSVCIPFFQSTNTTQVSEQFIEIIDTVAIAAPTDGGKSVLNINSFTLQEIVPTNVPFYSYTSTNEEDVLYGQVIVYDLKYAIPINSNTIAKLNKIIISTDISLEDDALFINNAGANDKNNSEDGIYISCQPTGSSNEEINISKTNNKNLTHLDLMTNPILLAVLKWIGFILILFIGLFIINIIYGKISKNKDIKIVPNNFLNKVSTIIPNII